VAFFRPSKRWQKHADAAHRFRFREGKRGEKARGWRENQVPNPAGPAKESHGTKSPVAFFRPSKRWQKHADAAHRFRFREGKRGEKARVWRENQVPNPAGPAKESHGTKSPVAFFRPSKRWHPFSCRGAKRESCCR